MAEQNTKIIFKPLQQTSIFPGLLDGFAHSQKITQKWVKQNDIWEITDVSVVLMNETRVGHTNIMTREHWLEIQDK